MIRGVISDFCGVLTTSMDASFAGFSEAAGLSRVQLRDAIDLVTERDGAHPLFELECGRIAEPEFARRVEGALLEVTGREISMGDFSERLWAGLGVEEPMVALLTELREAGWPLALLTNNVREWGPYWRPMVPVDELFDVVIDSAYVGLRKPDPAIFALTVARFGVPAQECLFVDDFEHNCQAARAAGMTAVRFDSSEQAISEIRAALGVEAGSGASQLGEPSRSQR